MKQKIRLTIPTVALIANIRLITKIMDKIEKVTGTKLPPPDPEDLAMNIETKGMSVKTTLVDGMTIEMDTEFFTEMLDVYGDVAVSFIDAAVIVKDAMDKAVEANIAMQDKWIGDPEE